MQIPNARARRLELPLQLSLGVLAALLCSRSTLRRHSSVPSRKRGCLVKRKMMSRASKLSPRHSTRTDAVERLYRAIKGYPEITKFALGVIKPHGSGGQPRLKIVQESGALRLTVRGGTAVQVFRVYSKNALKTRIDIIREAQAMGWAVGDEEKKPI
jgi:hypothetical protein